MTEPFDDLAALKRDLELARSREPAGNALHTVISALLAFWPGSKPEPEPEPRNLDGGDNGR